MGLGSELIRRFGLHFMTPAANLESILAHGLLSRNAMLARGIAFVDMSDHEVQALRRRPEPVFDRSIHDYVPLYLNHMNAMLFRRRELRDSLVVLQIRSAIAAQPGVVFCDGNAAAADTGFAPDPDILGASLEALEAEYWIEVEDGRRRRMAEVLIPDVIPADAIEGVVCNNHELAERIHFEHDLYPSVDTSKFF